MHFYLKTTYTNYLKAGRSQGVLFQAANDHRVGVVAFGRELSVGRRRHRRQIIRKATVRPAALTCDNVIETRIGNHTFPHHRQIVLTTA